MTVNHLAQPLGVRLTQLPHHTVPKWSKGAVCKTAIHEFKSHQCVLYGVLAQLVQSACLSRRKSGVQIPYTPHIVWYISWLDCHPDKMEVLGSNPSQTTFGSIAPIGQSSWFATSRLRVRVSSRSTLLVVSIKVITGGC